MVHGLKRWGKVRKMILPTDEGKNKTEKVTFDKLLVDIEVEEFLHYDRFYHIYQCESECPSVGEIRRLLKKDYLYLLHHRLEKNFLEKGHQAVHFLRAYKEDLSQKRSSRATKRGLPGSAVPPQVEPIAHRTGFATSG